MLSSRFRPVGSFWRQLALLSVAIGLIPAYAAPALADKRVALIVGNSAYVNIPRLENPRNDAKLIADTLRTLGFTLVGGNAQLDLDKEGLDRAVQEFGGQLQGADVALFYYAGHGVGIRGTNFLVPVSANPIREADVDFQMLDSNLVLRQMEGAGAKLNIVILDACRNNPFSGRGLRSSNSGLSQMQAPEGTMISFATQPGNVALDGTDGNSPYTTALAAAMRKPGLDIFRTFNEVGLAVSAATGGAQKPFLTSSPIQGEFFFGPPNPAAQAAVAAIAAPSQPDLALQAWSVIQNSTSVAVIEDFIRQFSATPYGSMARARLDELRKSQIAAAAPQVAAAPSAPPIAVQPAPPQSVPSATAGLIQPAPIATSPPQNQERLLRPKDVFRDCDVCPEMIVVPAGTFTMGSPPSEKGRTGDEGPEHLVAFARPFAVGKFSVTFGEWDACVAGGGCNGYRPGDLDWGRDRQPVININWNDAKAYVAWLSRKTGKPYRLLTESEREYVTRAGTRSAYWTGPVIAGSQANYNATAQNGPYLRRSLPVDSYAPNAWGLYQVHGNIEEWTEDCYSENYNVSPTDGSPWVQSDCRFRVVRGGSWAYRPVALRSADRAQYLPTYRGDTVGLRVARAL